MTYVNEKIREKQYTVLRWHRSDNIQAIIIDLEKIKMDLPRMHYNANDYDWDFRKQLRAETKKLGFSEVTRMISKEGFLRLKVHMKSEGVFGWIYDNVFRGYSVDICDGTEKHYPAENIFGDIVYQCSCSD